MTFKPWQIITNIVGFISAVILAFNRGKKSERQENINNNHKEIIASVKRRNARNDDSIDDVRERLLKNARNAK